MTTRPAAAAGGPPRSSRASRPTAALDAPTPRRRRRRAHPARDARTISTAAAATITLGMVAALGLAERPADVASAAAVPDTGPVDRPAAAPVAAEARPVVVVVRRLHVRPRTTAAVIDPAAIDPAAIDPAAIAPAVRAPSVARTAPASGPAPRPARRAARTVRTRGS